MKILVTGAKGMLGNDLCLMLKNRGFKVFEADIHNMDITDLKSVKAVINKEKPSYIVHAAAYTDVDRAESDKDKAMLINKTGSENISKVSSYLEIPVFLISTDYVFDGTKDSPYQPKDKTCPVNFYGKTKLEGEHKIKENNPLCYIFRTSWLYGLHGKNFVKTMINLAEKNGEIRVVDDQKGCPTWTIELAKVIISFIENPREYGIYHVCGSGNTSWYGFAKKIMECMNTDKKVIPVSSEEFPRPAKRPAYSVMDNKGLCPDWQKSLEEYISKTYK